MAVLPVAFIIVSLIFAIASTATGLQAILSPIAFSHSFGIPIPNQHDSKPTSPSAHTQTAITYVSLMGVRQLATGIILLIFAYQGKWIEMATMLSVLGILVAGTDGVFLAFNGVQGKAGFHAVPGALIAGLAGAFLLSTT